MVLQLSAQNLKRGYKSLEKGDYSKAKETFLKAVAENKESVAANFGLAMSYADDKSPFFNIIESWQYISVVQGNESKLSQEEIEIIKEYFLNTEVRKTSRPVKKKLEIAVEAVEDRLIKYIREENNLEAVYKVLEKYPDFRHYDNVVHIRNQFEFRKYEKINTRSAYEEFINKFPDAAQVTKAKRYIDKLAFKEVKARNTVPSYNNYIKSYPKSEFLQEAIKLRNATAFADARRINTLATYEGFINSYPDALEIGQAKKQQRQLMFEKAKRMKTLQAYNDFIRKYPDGTFYNEVFNLKAGALGMKQFKEVNIGNQGLVMAKSFDYNEQIDKAKAFAITNDGGYILAGTTQGTEKSYTDAWIIKLDSKGNMLWNKMAGQQFNDDVSNVLITKSGEIIVIGTTEVIPGQTSKSAWMFKLGKDGKKIWNKNIGKYKIVASAYGPDNKIYIASYVEDTIPDNYYLQAFNPDGKKVWERDYVGEGIFNDIAINGPNFFLAGSKWFIYCDSKMYLKWEDTLKVDAEVIKADINSNSVILAASDSATHYMLSYSIDGTKKWQKTNSYTSNDNIIDITLTKSNELVVLGENSTSGGYAKKFNNMGKMITTKSIPAGYKFVDAIRNKNGGISYLLSGKDYLLISFSSSGF